MCGCLLHRSTEEQWSSSQGLHAHHYRRFSVFDTRYMSSQVGADLVMGSLIKSPGGTIVPGGGYIAGRADLVAAAAARLTAPGVGMDAGGVSGSTLRLMAQGATPKTSHLCFHVFVILCSVPSFNTHIFPMTEHFPQSWCPLSTPAPSRGLTGGQNSGS